MLGSSTFACRGTLPAPRPLQEVEVAGLLKGPRNLISKDMSKVVMRITLVRAHITPTITLLTNSLDHLTRLAVESLGQQFP